MNTPVNLHRAHEIFHSYASRKLVEMKARNGRLVHYTSAEAAASILKNKEVWMRKSNVMNDFLEIEHGWDCLYTVIHSNPGKKFKDVLESISQGLYDEALMLFDQWTPHFKGGTFITSVSEHDDAEDCFGRLSMWRAYGGSTGVALVFNSAPFFSESDALKAYSYPVSYLSEKEAVDRFENFVQELQNNKEEISCIDRDCLKGLIFDMLRFGIVCTKHPGFREEREWRIVHTPHYDRSQRLISDLQTIRGIPQAIYKIPLKDIVEEGLVGIEIPQLVDRIIIGPTQYPAAMREAFVMLLRDAGVSEPVDKVWMSEIPLRQ